MLIAPKRTYCTADSRVSVAPWWGVWSAFLIVGCFYLTQAIGIFMVQLVAGLGAGFSQGADGSSDLDQTWLLPLSLFLSTIGAGMVATFQDTICQPVLLISLDPGSK